MPGPFVLRGARRGHEDAQHEPQGPLDGPPLHGTVPSRFGAEHQQLANFGILRSISDSNTLLMQWKSPISLPARSTIKPFEWSITIDRFSLFPAPITCPRASSAPTT